MKIIIGNRIIDTNVEAVCIELSEEEKNHIANMGDQKRYASFPDSWNDVAAANKLKFMSGDYLPDTDIRVYFDKVRKLVCVRSDVDGLFMHYTDGSKYAIDMLSLIQNFVFLFSEPKTNWMRLSTFILRQQVRSGCRTYNPGKGEHNFSVIGIDYHWNTDPKTEEEWRDHTALVDWLNIHQSVHADIYFEIRGLSQ